MNGIGVVAEELTDLYQENEELKEQVHKLAGQVEMMRLLQMQVNNRHLKCKHSSASVLSQTGLAAPSPAAGSSCQLVSSTGPSGSTGNLTLAGARHLHHLNHMKHLNSANASIDGVSIGLVTGIVGGLVPPNATFNMSAVPIQRISPAAELQSERV